MKCLLKNILSLFLLLAGCLPVILSLFFLYKQQLIRHEMKEKLEKEVLSTVTIPAKDVIWVKPEKEISINSRMFDVESYSVTNGLVTFTGLYDDEETALNKSLEENTGKKNNRNYQILTRLFHVLQSLYFNTAENPATETGIRTVYNHLILQHISSPFINILKPPPRAAASIYFDTIY